MNRLTPAFLTMLLFGVIALLVVGYFAKGLFATPKKEVKVSFRNIPMPIADIPAGTTITENHVGLGKILESDLRKEDNRDVLIANRVIVGRVTKDALKAATPIHANQLLQPGELPELKIGPNMRAITISVGDSTAFVDGMIRPNQYVDVLFTLAGNSVGVNDRYQGGMTLRLFEGVKVLAVNRNQLLTPVERSSNRVTLELTEAQANVITLASSKGSLTLTSNPNGPGHGGLSLSNDDLVTLNQLLGIKPVEPPKEPFTTEIIRRSSRSSMQFNDKGRIIGGGWGGGNSGGYNQSVQNGYNTGMGGGYGGAPGGYPWGYGYGGRDMIDPPIQNRGANPGAAPDMNRGMQPGGNVPNPNDFQAPAPGPSQFPSQPISAPNAVHPQFEDSAPTATRAFPVLK